jgi:hypothetical protein
MAPLEQISVKSLAHGQIGRFSPCRLGYSNQRPSGYWPKALTARLHTTPIGTSTNANTKHHSTHTTTTVTLTLHHALPLLQWFLNRPGEDNVSASTNPVQLFFPEPFDDLAALCAYSSFE